LAKTVSRQRVAERERRVNDAAADHVRKVAAKSNTQDSFQNFAMSLGIGTDNALSGSTYGFNPLTRVRTLLEWMYRGSWLAGAAVDIRADDMTRNGIEYSTLLKPKDIEGLMAAEIRFGMWDKMNEAVKWGKLYGGSLMVMMIDGQNQATELRLDTIKKGQFKGFLVLDRWMVEPSMESLVQEMGPNTGLPMFYRVVADAPGLAKQVIHHSRVIRFGGVRLPYYQRVAENMWDMSVIERLYDRMVAFDSSTQGAAQLVHKSFLRTLKLKGLRQAAITGGTALAGITAQVDMMRRFQSNEGITMIDADDDLVVEGASSFSGIAEALGQFGQQISGALEVPLTRLFGQSPTGFNSGDSDIRNYNDSILHDQEKHRVPVQTALQVMAKSEGIRLPDNFGWNFRPLYQLDDTQKADIAGKITDAVSKAMEGAIIGRKTALTELRNSAKLTGLFTSITDKDINEAESDPPDPSEMMGEGGEGKQLPSEEGANKGAEEGSETGEKD
jgi:phage-related protein (TIGR01555 family)